jgi:hypothetical protein
MEEATHTAVDVPVMASGPGAEKVSHGKIDNTRIIRQRWFTPALNVTWIPFSDTSKTYYTSRFHIIKRGCFHTRTTYAELYL